MSTPRLGQHGGERRDDRGHVSVPTELAHETSAPLQCAGDAGDGGAGIPDPVQDGVREHRVELGLEGERGGVHQAGVDAAVAGRRDHCLRMVDANHLAAGVDDVTGQRAITATEVQDALAGPRREKREHGASQHRHEARVGLIILGVPGLLRRHDRRSRDRAGLSLRSGCGKGSTMGAGIVRGRQSGQELGWRWKVSARDPPAGGPRRAAVVSRSPGHRRSCSRHPCRGGPRRSRESSPRVRRTPAPPGRDASPVHRDDLRRRHGTGRR